MAVYPQVGVNQGDTIYFFDTSLGDVVARDWNFPGGTPTGATSWGPAIVYESPNASGWDVKLLVTDTAGITAMVEPKNIIVVFPENFNVNFTATPSSSLMDQNVVYQSTGTAASGLTGSGYNWNIPGTGATSGASLSTITYAIPQWFDLTGYYSGAPNQLYLATATLTATSNLGNTQTATRNLNFYKLGPEESVNYADSGTYAISGPYYTPSVFPYTTGGISLGGSNLILEINQNFPSEAWNNSYFHSTDEAVYFYPNTSDYSADYSELKFKFIWNGTALSSGGVSFPAYDRFNIGNYIIAGDVLNNFSDKFWITDYTTGGASITEFYQTEIPGGRNWSSSYLVSFLSNTYHISTSSKYIENGGFTGVNKLQNSNTASVIGYDTNEQGYDWDGGYGATAHGVCVPSSALVNAFYKPLNITVDLDITIYDNNGNSLDSVSVTLSSPGATGNSSDGYLLLAQSNSNGVGIVSKINTAISSSGLDGYVLAEEATYFAPYQGGGFLTSPSVTVYSSSDFHGIRLSVIQPTYLGTDIGSLEVVWGTNYSTGVLESDDFTGSILQLPFAGTTPNPGDESEFSSFNSWTGLDERVYANPNTSPYFRGWKLGGSL